MNHDHTEYIPFHIFYAPELKKHLQITSLMREHTRITINAVAALHFSIKTKKGRYPWAKEGADKVVESLIDQIDEWGPRIIHIMMLGRIKRSLRKSTVLFSSFKTLLREHIMLFGSYANALYKNNKIQQDIVVKKLLNENTPELGKISARIVGLPAARHKKEITKLWMDHVLCTKDYADILNTGNVILFDKLATKCMLTSIKVGEWIESKYNYNENNNIKNYGADVTPMESHEKCGIDKGDESVEDLLNIL